MEEFVGYWLKSSVLLTDVRRKTFISEKDNVYQNTAELFRRGLHYTMMPETVAKGMRLPPNTENSPGTPHVIISVHFGRLTGNLPIYKAVLLLGAGSSFSSSRTDLMSDCVSQVGSGAGSG